MKAYERIRARPPGCLSLGESGETETPSTNGGRERRQTGPSFQPLFSTSTLLPTSAAANIRTPVTGRDYSEADALEPNLRQDMGLDGLTNLNQMGGIEMFFSQSIWPESALSGLVGESDGGGATSFDLGNFFGLYDTQPQF